MCAENKMDEIERLLRPGELTLSGFLGDDVRPLEEIIGADAQTLADLGLSNEDFAVRMERLTTEGKDLMERPKEVEHRYNIVVRDDRGPMPDPFGGAPKRKGDTILHDGVTGKDLRWNALTIAMIREHGFFSGRGSPYRLEPDLLAKALNLI